MNINLSEKINELIFYLDDVEGNKLFREIKRNKLEVSDLENKKAFVSLQFLIIPFLETEQIINLFKNYLSIGSSIEDLDLSERMNKKMINVVSLDERDEIKRQVKQSILNNSEQITDNVLVGANKNLNTISSWIIDYISNVGSQEKGLGRAKYFYEKQYYKSLSEDKKIALKKIFSLYDYLNRSSYTPLGFEDDLLMMTEDGKLITTNKGEVVVLYDTKSGESFFPQEQKVRRVSNPPMTTEEKKVEKLINVKQQLGENKLAGMVVDEEIDNTKKIDDLKIMLNRYKDSSLQKRAIEEEIRKLERR